MKQFWPILLLCSMGVHASAEVIYLKGGTILRGKILQKNTTELVIEVPQAGGNATVTLPMNRIRRIGPDSETPESMSEEGMTLLKAGRLEQADGLFNDALRQRPTHIPARIGRALVAGSRNDSGQAVRQLRRTLLLAPGSPDAWYYLGYFQIRQADYNSAQRSLRRALALTTDKQLTQRITAQLRRIRTITAQKSRALSAQVAKTRANWNRNLGNNPDAAGTGVVLQQMLKTLTRQIAQFKGDIYVELKAPRTEELNFLRGGNLLRYRHAVRIAQVSFLAPMTSYEKLTNREKREIIGGWIRYMKDLYPFATTIAIVSNEHGQYLCEAIWVDLQEQVRFEWYRSRDARKK